MFYLDIYFGFIFCVSQNTFNKISKYFIDSINRLEYRDLVYVYGVCPLSPRGQAVSKLTTLKMDKKIVLRTAVWECIDSISGFDARQKYAFLIVEGRDISEYYQSWNDMCVKTDTLLIIFNSDKSDIEYSNIRILEGTEENIVKIMDEIHARRENIPSTYW